MKLETALDEFGLLQRRRHRGDEGRQTVAALAALREYLLDYSAYGDSTEVTASDLFTFLLEYYPAEEEPDAEVAVNLLEVAAAFALWLVERGERALAPFAVAADRLRDDLPRVLEALALLKEHSRRDDLAPPVLLTDEEDEQPVGAAGSGVNRVMRLDQIDYAAAEEEYYTVRTVEGASITLHSAEREALGEGPAGPVPLPPRAAELLRANDIIHAEIAPGPQGWELLEVFGIRPGGYA